MPLNRFIVLELNPLGADFRIKLKELGMKNPLLPSSEWQPHTVEERAGDVVVNERTGFQPGLFNS